MVFSRRSGPALALGLVGAALLWPQVGHAARVVYLNAEQTDINGTGQDPTTNSFNVTGFNAGTITGWPALTDEQKEQIVYLMKEASVDLDISYTWERPAAGTYDMLVMGTDTDHTAMFGGACSGAVGLADCEDTQAENISFLFYGCMPPDQQEEMPRVAFTAFAALGFGWGLENLSVSGQIMGSFTATALEFGDSCVPVSGGTCMHEGCADMQQNSSADLLARVGARVDDGPPVVTILSPANLEVVDMDFTLTADVEDGFGGLEVSLEAVEFEQTLVDMEPPWEWPLTAPEGMWTLRVTAMDADANEVTEEIVVCVGVEDCGTPSGSEESSTGSAEDEGTGSTAATTDGSTSDSGPIDPTDPIPQDSGSILTEPSKGCHCRSDGRSPVAALLGLLGFLLVRRRA